MAVLIAAICFMVLVGIFLAVVRPRRRARTLKLCAGRMGFSFSARAKPFAGSDVHGLSILEDGAETEAENVLSRSSAPLPLTVVDLIFSNESSISFTTVAAFRSSAQQLPSLEIGSRNLLEKLEEALGKKCLNLENDEEFTKHFYVHCSDEAKARAFLTNDMLARLREHADHFRIETSADWVLVYQPARKINPEHLPDFVEQTTRIAAALLGAQLLPAAA